MTDVLKGIARGVVAVIAGILIALPLLRFVVWYAHLWGFP